MQIYLSLGMIFISLLGGGGGGGMQGPILRYTCKCIFI